MESNASLERRGSMYFSPTALDAVDHAHIHEHVRSPSPEEARISKHDIKPNKPKKDIPVININRHKSNSEAQYADTEVKYSCFPIPK